MSPMGNMSFGELEVRPHEHAVLVHGDEVALSSREFEIVMALAEHPGWVLSASQLSADTVEGDYSPESVSVLVSRLRHKLALAGAPDVVETVRGAGYRLRSARAKHEESPEAAAVSRELRDALWQLQRAAIEVEQSASPERQHEAAQLLERARRAIYTVLAK